MLFQVHLMHEQFGVWWLIRSMGASIRDSDSEGEWGGDGYGSDGGASVAWDDGEVDLSPEDERAMAAFMVRH